MTKKQIAKKDIEARIEILSKKTKLISKMQAELNGLQELIIRFDSIDEKLFDEIPGDGLACDWLNKFS